MCNKLRNEHRTLIGKEVLPNPNGLSVGKATERNEKYHRILKEQQQHRKQTQNPKKSNKLRNEMTARNEKDETILNKPQQKPKQTQIPSIKTPNKQQTLNEY
jgi:hypothetical protein